MEASRVGHRPCPTPPPLKRPQPLRPAAADCKEIGRRLTVGDTCTKPGSAEDATRDLVVSPDRLRPRGNIQRYIRRIIPSRDGLYGSPLICGDTQAIRAG